MEICFITSLTVWGKLNIADSYDLVINISSTRLKEYVPTNIFCFNTEAWLGTCYRLALAGGFVQARK